MEIASSFLKTPYNAPVLKYNENILHPHNHPKDNLFFLPISFLYFEGKDDDDDEYTKQEEPSPVPGNETQKYARFYAEKDKICINASVNSTRETVIQMYPTR